MSFDTWDFPFSAFEELIRRGFEEDFVHEDKTSLACVPEDVWTKAQIVLKQEGCIAGLKFLPWIFQMHDPRITMELFAREGQIADKGSCLATLEGPARSILSAERVALNLVQHLSGVATLTAKCKAIVAGTSCAILDTRKTIVGLRLLQKYAVRVGGGTNHRLHLADRILIKDNHLALACRNSLESLSSCIHAARERYPFVPIEVEIDAPDLLAPALQAGADWILLDNMTLPQIRRCVALCQKQAFLEASGGMNVTNLLEYAQTGVDAISIGALTHSAPALDLSLKIK